MASSHSFAMNNLLDNLINQSRIRLKCVSFIKTQLYESYLPGASVRNENV